MQIDLWGRHQPPTGMNFDFWGAIAQPGQCSGISGGGYHPPMMVKIDFGRGGLVDPQDNVIQFWGDHYPPRTMQMDFLEGTILPG